MHHDEGMAFPVTNIIGLVLVLRRMSFLLKRRCTSLCIAESLSSLRCYPVQTKNNMHWQGKVHDGHVSRPRVKNLPSAAECQDLGMPAKVQVPMDLPVVPFCFTLLCLPLCTTMSLLPLFLVPYNS